MSFFKTLYLNITQPQWIITDKKTKGHAFGYFFLFVLFTSFLTMVPLFVGLPKGLDIVQDFLQNKTPDFTIKMENDSLSVENIPLPYIYGPNEDNFYLEIDTTKTAESIALQDIIKTESLSGVLLGNDEIHFFDNTSGEYHKQSFKDISENFTVTRGDIQDKIQSINTLPKTSGIVIFLILIFSFFFSLGKLIYLLLIVSIFFLIVSKKTQHTFGEIFTFGLYAITIPTIIKSLLPFIPGLYTISLVLVLTYMLFPQVFRKKGNTKTEEVIDGKKEGKKE